MSTSASAPVKRGRGARVAFGFALAFLCANGSEANSAAGLRLAPGVEGFRSSGLGAIRGLTIGPIESALHPNKGYGSKPYEATLSEARAVGATWVSLTPFGRTYDTEPTGVDPSFEAPFRENRKAVVRAIREAHARGLKVFLVPHLWVESGIWRGQIDPGDEQAWRDFARSYRAFLLGWAKVAAATGVEMFSVGVELRSWVTTVHAPLFSDVIHDVRKIFPGLLTLAANWDDVERTTVWSDLDVIGINAFFPLSDKENAPPEALREGGRKVAERVRELARTFEKPIVFTEIGYTTRSDPAFKPWTWPDAMSGVAVDQAAQAEAYTALLAPLFDEDWFAGFFVWRVYADPDDLSQEAEWGFSPRGKLAELVVRDAFAAHFAADGPRPLGAALAPWKATRIGEY